MSLAGFHFPGATRMRLAVVTVLVTAAPQIASAAPDPGPPPALPPARSGSIPGSEPAPPTPTPAPKSLTPQSPAPQSPAPKSLSPTPPAPAPRPTGVTPAATPTALTAPTAAATPPALKPEDEFGFDALPAPPQPATLAPNSGDPALSAPASDPPTASAPAAANTPPPATAPAARGPAREITAEDIEAYEQKKREAERQNPKRWAHKGLILEFNIGIQGCFGTFCKGAGNLDSKPGLRLHGMLGRNTFGILDIGFELGWGTLTPGEVNGRNAVDLYNLDPLRLQQVINDRLGIDVVNFDISQAIATSVKLRTLNAGPTLRLHMLRRGRYDPYVGTGFHYQLWRARYETISGPARLDFHGFAVPLQLGFNVFVHPNIAVGARFDYMFTYYFLTALDHPDAAGLTIVSSLDEASTDTTLTASPTQDGLPAFWAFTLGVRARF